MTKPNYLYIDGSKDVPSSIIKLGESIMQKTGIKEGDAVKISINNKQTILWVRKSEDQNDAKANSNLLNLLLKEEKGIAKITKTTLKESKYVELKALGDSFVESILDTKRSLIFTPVVENGYIIIFTNKSNQPISFKVQKAHPSPSFITTTTKIFFS
ncbi:MAG TPA: hypothetical protein ENJ59_02840 [Thermofilum sp.]|nr:hypothetical protein [Thermofilum sp.]